MARQWRLRHKLVLGLALVVGSVVLLLGGALFGLSSYVETMQTTERKLLEMQVVTQLRDHIHKIASAGQRRKPPGHGSQLDWEKEQILAAARDARHVHDGYKNMLATGGSLEELDPDAGESELSLVEQLDRAFDSLETAVARATGPGIALEGTGHLGDDPNVRAACEELVETSNTLFLFLKSDVDTSFDRAKANHRRSLVITGSATALAVILVLTLLYYFRVWVFDPIRQLQAGVQRVHRGDFDHPIALASRDELEELANEFNAMTVRLRDVYRNLAFQVNERTRQLVRSERMVSVGFLAAGVAHEINNPLASIAFCAEALERRLQDVLVRVPNEAEVVTKYLRMMQDEAQRCKQITQKLLDFSRSGGRRERADLNRLVQDVIEVAECLPNARGKRIEFASGGELVAPVSVPDVKGVVLNLVVNALDSMEEGGVVTIATAVRDESAEVTFTDAGCGMTPEVMENIFEPFFTRSRTGNGTGLGLSISHQIIDQHGGTITASSGGPGRGSTFTVRLPLRPVETRSETRDARAESPEGERSDVVPFPAVRTAA